MQAFTKYYDSRTAHRKLRWIHSLGTATLVANFNKRHEFVLSTYQAMVLLYFNTVESATLKQLEEAIKIPMPMLQRILKAFVQKHQVLLSSTGDEVLSTSTFSVNNGFKHSKVHISMIMVSVKTTDEERASTKQTVTEDRKHAIEASIVRVMKARKVVPWRPAGSVTRRRCSTTPRLSPWCRSSSWATSRRSRRWARCGWWWPLTGAGDQDADRGADQARVPGA